MYQRGDYLNLIADLEVMGLIDSKDRRIPRPQGEELHMTLKKLGVQTEFIVYPNMPHGLRNYRYQLIKMESEFAWFEKWIKGKKEWFDWKALLITLENEEKQ